MGVGAWVGGWVWVWGWVWGWMCAHVHVCFRQGLNSIVTAGILTMTIKVHDLETMGTINDVFGLGTYHKHSAAAG